MLHLKNFFTLSITILLTSIVCSCSSSDDIDPDVFFKGNVDASFLSELSRGESSITLELKGSYIFTMDYATFGTSEQKWERADNIQLDGQIFAEKITIHQGRTLDLLVIPPVSGNYIEDCISTLWYNYCQKTKFDKEIFVECRFDFNANDKKLTLDNREFEVEKADNNEIILSVISPEYRTDENKERVPVSMTKTIIVLSKTTFEEPDSENILTFETRKEALTTMIKMAHQEFGDTLHIAPTMLFPHDITYDIAQIEYYLLNDIPCKTQEDREKLCWYTSY